MVIRTQDTTVALLCIILGDSATNKSHSRAESAIKLDFFMVIAAVSQPLRHVKCGATVLRNIKLWEISQDVCLSICLKTQMKWLQTTNRLQ